MRYTVLLSDALPGHSTLPAAPSTDNGADTLADARALFRAWLAESDTDSTRADELYADVVLTDAYDGISYGDITGGDGICRLTRGPRGGVITQRV